MPVRSDFIWLLGMILVISGCSTCQSCRTTGHASVPDNACGAASHCKPPMWYWSNGRYISILDDYLTQESARKCALKSLNQSSRRNCGASYDFRQGYIQAFIDLAHGSRGVVPAVPPPKYWKTNNRSIHGHSKAQQWFSGYRAGLSEADCRQVPEQTIIPTSRVDYLGRPGGPGNYY